MRLEVHLVAIGRQVLLLAVAAEIFVGNHQTDFTDRHVGASGHTALCEMFYTFKLVQ